MLYREVTACRVCTGSLEPVLDLGEQCLAGRFPRAGEPDPPQVPLRLAVCATCGLAQLLHTVDPEEMFRDYGYRSGVTGTMTAHLRSVAGRALAMFPDGVQNLRVLDIGCNDGTLLRAVPGGNKVGIDPSDVEAVGDWRKIKGFFPQDLPADLCDFDLIFTLACFYDADDPAAFARAVAARLAWNGLWCVEVADAGRMARLGTWDAVLHEHLCYYEAATFEHVCQQAGLAVIRRERTECNGGSLLFFVVKQGIAPLKEIARSHRPTALNEWHEFANRVYHSRDLIGEFLAKNAGKKVHLLGASTKANVWLQAAGASPTVIQAASDRDPRKAGRRTPGTNIPIVSEEDSRAQRPDVYVSPLYHFREEVVAREKAFLDGGGQVMFPLPALESVGGKLWK